MIKDAIRKNSITLGLFGGITAVLLATTFTFTKDNIIAAERRMAEKALLEILPASSHHNDLLLDIQKIPEQYWPTLGLKQGGDVHIARNANGQPIAAIIPATAPDGYNGAIKLMIGVLSDGTVAGVRVVNHTETPGLGDKIDVKKSDWILGFDNKSLRNPQTDQWKVKKDGGAFDQFTGATITPRAVVKQVAATLAYFNQDQARLFKAALKNPVAVEVNNHE
jgi:electron transport complex protein RnfG